MNYQYDKCMCLYEFLWIRGSDKGLTKQICKLQWNKGRKQLALDTCYISFRLLCSDPSRVSTAPWTIREAYWPSPPHPQRLSAYSSCSSHSVYSRVTPCHRESSLSNLHYFGLPCMAEVLQQRNVGHIIQVSNNLQLRCQNLKVGDVCNVETEPRSGKGSPPSTQPCFYFEGSGVQELWRNSYSRQSLETSDAGRWAGMNKHGLV